MLASNCPPPPDNQKMNNLRILSWNANGLRLGISELRDYLSTYDYEIILIEEVSSTHVKNFKIPNYNLCNTPRTENNISTPYGGKDAFNTHLLLR